MDEYKSESFEQEDQELQDESDAASFQDEQSLDQGEDQIEDENVTEQPMYPVAVVPDNSRFPLALGASLIAALAGGAIWFAIVYLTQYQIGIVAWGVGVLAGLGAVKLTPERSTRIGVVAAIAALIGLLFGKILIVQIMGAKELAQYLADDPPQEMITAWADDPEVMYRIACNNLRDAGEFDEALTDQAKEAYVISDDLSSDVLDAREKAIALSESWSDEEKIAQVKASIAKNADEIAKAFIKQYPLVDQIKDSLDFWDILWFFLALSSAYGIASGGKGSQQQG